MDSYTDTDDGVMPDPRDTSTASMDTPAPDTGGYRRFAPRFRAATVSPAELVELPDGRTMLTVDETVAAAGSRTDVELHGIVDGRPETVTVDGDQLLARGTVPLATFGADEVPGCDLASGDIIRHYRHGSLLVACRVELLDDRPTVGGRHARLVYGKGAVRSTVLDDAYLYERVHTADRPVQG